MYTYIYIQCQIYLLDFINGKPTCDQIKQFIFNMHSNYGN